MPDDIYSGNIPKDSEHFRTVPNSAEQFGKLPQDAVDYGNVPQPAAAYGNVRHDAEEYGKLRHVNERKERHILTVKEVARMFESAGVARIERSIINWCRPNKMGVARLDSFFDTNERKYFITPESVELAIKEEQGKMAQTSETAAAFGRVPHVAEPETSSRPATAAENSDGSKALQQEMMDLKITNRAKDMFIEQLQKERESFGEERRGYVEKLMSFNRKVGELETSLRQLSGPRKSWETELPKRRDAAEGNDDTENEGSAI